MACIPLQGGEGVGGKNGNARVCALRLIALEDGCDRRPTAVLVWFHMFQQLVNTIQQHMPSLRANTTIHQRPLPSPQLRDDGRKVGPLCGVLRPAALHELDPGREAGEGARAWQLSEGGGVGQGRAVAAHDLAHDLHSGCSSEHVSFRRAPWAIPGMPYGNHRLGVRCTAPQPVPLCSSTCRHVAREAGAVGSTIRLTVQIWALPHGSFQVSSSHLRTGNGRKKEEWRSGGVN